MWVPPSHPEEFVRNTIALRGAEGAEWLGRLPATLAFCEERWSVSVGPPFPELSYSYVAPVLQADGTATVLKLSLPNSDFRAEAEALRLFGGRGAARLLELDLERGAMLLERLEPGAPLTSVRDDEEATSIVAGVLKQLCLVERAEALFAELLPSQAEPVLLHGDLHHFNVLAAQRQPWLAVDPKGVVGEAAYDTGAFLRNPKQLLNTPHPGQVLDRRVDLLAEELDLDRSRVRRWAISQAVLAAYWGWEDSGRVWEGALTFAELLSGRKR